MKGNILVVLGYPLQEQIDIGHIDVLLEMYKNQLSMFDEVHIYSPRDKRSYNLGERIFVHSGGGEKLPRPIGLLLDMWNVWGLCRKHKIRIMRALAPHTSGVICLVASKLTGIPYICSVHMHRTYVEKEEKIHRNPVSNFILDNAEKMAYRGAAAIPYISSYVKEYILSMGAPENKLVYHPNFVDLSVFIPKKAFPEKPSKIICVGRLVKVKGVEYLLEALVSLKGFTLTICGDGPEKENLEKMCRQLGIEKSVRFAGNVSHTKELPRLLAESDIFVAPLSGGFALIESMAAGLPVVVGNVEWSAEIIKDGINGFVVEPRNPKSIAEALLKISNNSKLAERMSKENSKLASSLFSLESWKKRELDFYSKALR